MPRIYWPVFLACAFFASLPITASILFGNLTGFLVLLVENVIFFAIASIVSKCLP